MAETACSDTKMRIYDSEVHSDKEYLYNNHQLVAGNKDVVGMSREETFWEVAKTAPDMAKWLIVKLLKTNTQFSHSIIKSENEFGIRVTNWQARCDEGID